MRGCETASMLQWLATNLTGDELARQKRHIASLKRNLDLGPLGLTLALLRPNVRQKHAQAVLGERLNWLNNRANCGSRTVRPQACSGGSPSLRVANSRLSSEDSLRLLSS